MSEVVINQGNGIIGIFAGEAEWISQSKVAGRKNHFTERGVLVVGGNGAVGCGDEFGDILVAVDGIQLKRGVRLVENKRACRDWFGWIPGEAVGDEGTVLLPTVAGNAEVVIVGEAVKAVGRAIGGCLKILSSTSLVVEGHCDE